ncbi:hypothetical protein ACQEDT_03750 [Agrobacterium pusense]|uniref:hypothetical protein n=1 Tax=Agrobacterium pusense TaxID=648995 RepID=UPI003D124585
MTKGEALGVIVCDLRGDDNRSISYLILSHLRQNYVRPIAADGGEGRPLVAAKFPLFLQGTGDTDQDDRRIEQRALKWLAKANADIIIWGDHSKSGNVNTINVLGLRSKERIHAKINVDFNEGALNDLIAEVVTREVASISTTAFSDPSRYDLATLRGILKNTESLIGSSFPGFNSSTELRIRESISNVLSEVCKRSSNAADWRSATENSHKIVVNLEGEKFSPRWATSVKNLLRFQTVSAWSGYCLDTLEFTLRAAEELEPLGLEPRTAASPSFAERVSILKYIAGLAAGKSRELVHSLIVTDQNTSKFAINLDYGAKNKQSIFLTNRESLSNFMEFIESLSIEEEIKCFIITEYLLSIFQFEAEEADYYDIIRYLLSFIKDESPLTSLSRAWKIFFSLFILARVASTDGFSLVLDADRSTPIEYLMRHSASKLGHFSSIFPNGSSTRIEFFNLTAHVLAICAIYSEDPHVFKISEDFWSETFKLATAHFSARAVSLQIARCIDLNNWGARKADPDALDHSIEISRKFALDQNLPSNDRVHSGYVLAFAWAAKAAVGRHTDRVRAKRDAQEAMDICLRCEAAAGSADYLSTRASMNSVRKLRGYIDELELL